MKIKNVIAGLMAGILIFVNLPAVCLAADNGTAGDSAITATDDAAGTDAESTDQTAATAADALAEMGITINLPDGIGIDADGNITFNISDFSWSVGGAEDAGTDTGMDGDGTASDAEETAETKTIGTVNVNSDTYLNLRSGAGLDNSVIGHLLRGTEVEVIGEDGDWYEVTVPETTGYVYKAYLDVEEQEAEQADGPEEETEDGGLEEQLLAMMLYMMMPGMGDAETGETPSLALTPDGNLTLADDYAENNADGSGKQFITLVTKAGNAFYLIIDRDDEGEQTVHFLNLVDEADLLALMEEDEAAKYATPTETVTPAEEETTEAEEPAEEVEEAATKTNAGPLLLLLIALIGGGGFFAYTKFFKGGKKKEQAKPDPDADYTDDDEEDFGIMGEDDFEDMDDDGGGIFDADDDEPV